MAQWFGALEMGSLYHADILKWSEDQAGILRQLAAGLRVNEAPDWANIIEEIESVGSSQLSAVRSNLVQALLHDLKALAWPDAPYVPHWRAEGQVFRDNAAADFTPSMRQRIDLAALYRRVLRGLPATIDGQPPLPVPVECPVTLDDLLRDHA